MTVEQSWNLPDPKGPWMHELHSGRIVRKPLSPCGLTEIAVLIEQPRNSLEQDARLRITQGATAVWPVKPERREIIVIGAESRRTPFSR